MSSRRGTLFVLSGPSGTGKGTVMDAFFKVHGNDGVFLSISATTRKPRAGEIDGVNYYFISEHEFLQMISDGALLEWANFCGNYYGTPLKKVEDKLRTGVDVILEIEVQGAIKVMEACPEAVFVFIAPPSMEELRTRIVNRKTESEAVIAKRLETAVWEISNVQKYQYIIVNDEVQRAAQSLWAVVLAERLRTDKNKTFIDEVCKK